MQPISIVGDATTPTVPLRSNPHVLTFENSFPTVTAYGLPVTVLNTYVDSTHTHNDAEGTPKPFPFSLSLGSATVTVGGFPVHRLGDTWSCGDITDVPFMTVPTVFVGL